MLFIIPDFLTPNIHYSFSFKHYSLLTLHPWKLLLFKSNLSRPCHMVYPRLYLYAGIPSSVYRSLIINTYGLILRKMAVKIKDLYGNSGNRFRKINNRCSFQ